MIEFMIFSYVIGVIITAYEVMETSHFSMEEKIVISVIWPAWVIDDYILRSQSGIST